MERTLLVIQNQATKLEPVTLRNLDRKLILDCLIALFFQLNCIVRTYQNYVMNIDAEWGKKTIA